MPQIRTIKDAQEVSLLLDVLADEIRSSGAALSGTAFVGIQRRGVNIAEALAERVRKADAVEIPIGSLDITLYRDDWTVRGPKPSIGPTRIHFDLTGRTVILVDDVLYSGRTIRAALEALEDYGRPSRIKLLALVDRGHRELPIQPDFVGLKMDTAREDRVDVRVRSLDGQDAICLVSASPGQ